MAFVRLLTSSGLRRGEGGSLLTFALTVRRIGGGRYYQSKVAAAVTRSERPQTFYVAADALSDVEAYVESSRAWVVPKAQRLGRYELPAPATAAGHRGDARTSAGAPVANHCGVRRT
ncbi:hypothetical protein [Streptomyces sp. NPDC018833]|uniref:hypothetical protein n=1 Tax=Streptomyces sp. NPDC018833 TaxID=3365053 RepID=UPI0037ACB85B